jgi:2,3-bisphosphoglycerate-independent phosphoglycerate mutase
VLIRFRRAASLLLILSKKRTNMTNEKQRVLVLILDGIGFNPDLEATILERAWDGLADEVQQELDAAIDATPALANVAEAKDRATARALLMTPTLITQSNRLLQDGVLTDDDIPALQKVRAKLFARRAGGREIGDQLHAARAEKAYTAKYIPWCSKTPTLWNLREQQPTFVAHPAGIFAGYPDIAPKPAIMGNSDTGHQQIMNLCVAKQISTTITDMMETGEIQKIAALNAALKDVTEKDGGQVVVRFMASGEFGDDGFVHSCIPHFEGFLKLYFDALKLPADRLRIQLILDGRDSPPNSSIVSKELDGRDRYNFLGKVRKILGEYDAEKCVSWILGRQFMDRDYKGAMVRADYELLTRNKGREVADFDAAIEQIAADHADGKADPQVEPMVIGEPQPVDGNTLFFNLQFRADRQEPITACLLGMKDFVLKQATEKKKLDTWDNCDWFADLDGLKMFTLAEYNSDFTGDNCTPIATDEPHAHNLLWLLHQHAPDFRFFFLGEGVKEKHVGMFSRGRRSQPLNPNEDRHIVPSYGREDGVNNDNDFYKKTMMRHPEIGDILEARLAEKKDDLILVNVPGADMVGHLVMAHFDAGIETLESLESFTKQSLDAAAANGWNVVITADHGNLEHYGADHGNNDILISVVVNPSNKDALGDLKPSLHGGATARLFDVSHTALKLSIGSDALDGKIPAYPEIIQQSDRRLIGQPLLS